MSREQIKSRSHPFVHKLREVRDGKDKSLVFCEGWRLVEDLLRTSWVVREVFCTEAEQEKVLKCLRQFQKSHIPVTPLSEGVMEFVSDLETAPGLVALADRPPENQKIILGNDSALLVVLHRINTPQNLGNIFRTCEAAGVSQVHLTTHSADPYSPKVLRGSMGSAFRLSITGGWALTEILEKLKQAHIPVYAASQDGRYFYDEVNWNEPSGLVLGSEANGFTPDELKLFEQTIQIPMAGGVESLNVGTAAAVCLFEAVRQRKSKKV